MPSSRERPSSRLELSGVRVLGRGYHPPMRPRMPLLVGMSVVTCLVTARADVMPDEAYGNKEVVAATEIAGVSRFPDHVFYVFPAACTEAVARFTASFESDAQDVAIDPRFYYADENSASPMNDRARRHWARRVRMIVRMPGQYMYTAPTQFSVRGVC